MQGRCEDVASIHEQVSVGIPLGRGVDGVCVAAAEDSGGSGGSIIVGFFTFARC